MIHTVTFYLSFLPPSLPISPNRCKQLVPPSGFNLAYNDPSALLFSPILASPPPLALPVLGLVPPSGFNRVAMTPSAFPSCPVF